jgi:hypothetical protein
MAAVNPNALSKFVGILEVALQATPGSLTRVASVRGLVSNFDNTVNAVDIKADDTGTVFKGYIPEVRFEGSFLENADRDTIALILGGTPSDVSGVLVPGATQVVASGDWGYNDPVVVENQNGDGSPLTINSVTGGTDGLLVANTDYFVGQNAAGQTIVTIIDSTTVTTESQSMTIDYDYTPNSREDLTFPVVFTETPRLYVKITATDSASGNTRIFIIDDAAFEGIYGLEALDVVEAGDLTGTTFVFKANKGSNFIYQNEII